MLEAAAGLALPDNGAPMKSVTLLTKMYDLGVTPSRTASGQQR